MTGTVRGQNAPASEFTYEGKKYQLEKEFSTIMFYAGDSMHHYDSVTFYYRKQNTKKAYRICVMYDSIVVAKGPIRLEQCTWDPEAYYAREGFWFYYDPKGKLMQMKKEKFICICVKC